MYVTCIAYAANHSSHLPTLNVLFDGLEQYALKGLLLDWSLVRGFTNIRSTCIVLYYESLNLVKLGYSIKMFDCYIRGIDLIFSGKYISLPQVYMHVRFISIWVPFVTIRQQLHLFYH